MQTTRRRVGTSPGCCNLKCFVVRWCCRKAYKRLVLPGTTNAEEVMHMSDYEMLMLIFTIIGMFLVFYKQGKNDK